MGVTCCAERPHNLPRVPLGLRFVPVGQSRVSLNSGCSLVWPRTEGKTRHEGSVCHGCEPRALCVPNSSFPSYCSYTGIFVVIDIF